MPRTVAVTGGQIFQDGTGLTVRVQQIDTNDRIHFSVVEDQEVTRSGEMSFSAFINRFTRIESVEDACVRIRRLGYVASRRVRIYGEEFELLSDPFPEHDRIAIHARAIGESSIRILRLPVTLIPSSRGQRSVRAA
jgi:hypothetical protein